MTRELPQQASEASMSDSKMQDDGDKENDDVVDMEEDEDDPIDDEQLQEYQEMVEQLGSFPVSQFSMDGGKSRAIECYL
jgi:hypothetical protein